MQIGEFDVSNKTTDPLLAKLHEWSIKGLAVRIDYHTGRTTFMQLPECGKAADEISRLRWLPEKASGDYDPWNDGWNRCLEFILDKRAGIEPGTGEHE